MKFRFDHNNINVYDLEKSIRFYETNLGLTIAKRKQAADGSFELVFMTDGTTTHNIELTWMRDWEKPYNLGDNEFHLALRVDNYEEALAFHKEQGVVCFENTSMGIYFIEDPDGYWVEILPTK